jgi:phage terminase large subunit
MMQEKLDPITLAQEIDLDYAGSVDGLLIRSEWVQAAINAHVKLGIEPSGHRMGALDIADQGKDLNCYAWKHGILVQGCESWSGKGSHIFASTEKAFQLSDENGIKEVYYDSDGIGSGVAGDACVINQKRNDEAVHGINFVGYRGSAKIFEPRGQMVYDRYNEDFFLNYKAQAWWALRMRFQETYKAVVEGREYDPDMIISLAGDMPELNRLVNELSQPRYKKNTVGKMFVDKAPDGMASPNHADTIVMLFHPESYSTSLWDML